MLIFRIVGVLLILLGFAALAYDGAEMLASPGELTATSLRDHWTQISPGGVEKAKELVERLRIPGLWDPVLLWILTLPAWTSLGGAGVLFYWLGHRRNRATIVIE